MGRKSISPKTRSIPVSFSVKPHLADKIENLAYDQRFTRSKFLQEAVLRYINFIEMNDSPMLHDMSAEQRVVIGANALQEANKDGDEIRPSIIEHLRKQLRLFDASQELENEGLSGVEKEATAIITASGKVTKSKYEKGEYTLWADGHLIGRAKKIGKIWRAVAVQSPDFNIMWNPTLKGLIEIIQISVAEGNVKVVG
jgi:hypothetical protein